MFSIGQLLTAVIVALSGGLLTAVAQDPESPPVSPNARTISLAEWTQGGTAGTDPIEIEFTVTYHDPDWDAMWVTDGQQFSFVEPGPEPGNYFSRRLRARIETPAAEPGASIVRARITDLGAATIEFTPVTVADLDTREFDSAPIEIEALVDRVEPIGENHVNLTLAADGQNLIGRVQHPNTQAFPDIVDHIVRFRGVYGPKFDDNGELAVHDMFAQSVAQLEVLHPISADSRFARPVTPIGELVSAQDQELVRIAGRVVAQTVGHSITIRDNTGQIQLLSGQIKTMPPGSWVDAIGCTEGASPGETLTAGYFRAARRDQLPTDLTGTPAVFQLAASILETPTAVVEQAVPVDITGIVTWSSSRTPFFFITDPSGGLRINRGDTGTVNLAPGNRVTIKGHTVNGAYAPEVTANAIEILGTTVLPPARSTSLEDALSGRFEGAWVEMTGFLHSARSEGYWTDLFLTTASGDFRARVPQRENLEDHVGRVVTMSAVISAVTNSKRQITGIQLWLRGRDFIQAIEEGPVDGFDLPLSPLSSLGRFAVSRNIHQRLKVAGTVVHQTNAQFLYISEAGETLRVLSRSDEAVALGDQIEAVGLFGRRNGRDVIREARYRVIGHEPLPVPHDLNADDLIQTELDGQFVTLEGELVELTLTDEQLQLILQKNDHLFEAQLDASAAGSPQADDWLPRSTLQVTGIYLLEFDEHRHPEGFRILLQDPDSVVVTEPAPWLTPARVRLLLAILVASTISVLVRNQFLHSKVRRQTQEMREHMAHEAKLEAELVRVSKLDALGLLAGGIAHDFNNLLTVVLGSLTLARLDSRNPEERDASLHEAERAVIRARDLTQQLLTFSKGGSPVLSSVELPDVIQEVAEFAAHGSNARIVFDFSETPWPAKVDEGQIGQVIQNIVLNGIQSMPQGGTVTIGLRNEQVSDDSPLPLLPGRFLRLTVTDEGRGISPEDLGRVFDPYFSTRRAGNGLGLATVHSIVRKHKGHITVNSKLDHGTTMQIWLPASNENEPTVAPPIAKRVHPIDALIPKTTDLRGRVLIMDDEPQIVRVGSLILQKLNFDVVGVADGDEAVTAYRAAERDAEPFDLVILDLTIPGGKGGAETLIELQRINPEVKAIVSSGYSNDSTLSDYAAHGFVGIVRKPYELTELQSTIETVCGTR